MSFLLLKALSRRQLLRGAAVQVLLDALELDDQVKDGPELGEDLLQHVTASECDIIRSKMVLRWVRISYNMSQPVSVTLSGQRWS